MTLTAFIFMLIGVIAVTKTIFSLLDYLEYFHKGGDDA